LTISLIDYSTQYFTQHISQPSPIFWGCLLLMTIIKCIITSPYNRPKIIKIFLHVLTSRNALVLMDTAKKYFYCEWKLLFIRWTSFHQGKINQEHDQFKSEIILNKLFAVTTSKYWMQAFW